MAKTKIDWCNFSINPVKGLCPMACEYCYARRMYKRFHWDETIRYDDMVWQTGSPIYNGSKVFVGSTMELFGDWIKPDWMQYIFEYVKAVPKVTFIFLTKRPQNLIRYSPFPSNCWIGVSIPDDVHTAGVFGYLKKIEASVKFISFEPLLSKILKPEILEPLLKSTGINWLIIGQQTPSRPATQPKIEWIKDIVDTADQAEVPVFLKDNLQKALPFVKPFYRETKARTKYGYDIAAMVYRQEFPKEASRG